MVAGSDQDSAAESIIYSQLTKRELAAILAVIHKSLAVNTDKQLQELLLEVRRIVPCGEVICGLARTDQQGRLEEVLKIVNASYPADWMTLYLREGYVAVDPVVRHHFGRFGTQIWSDTFRHAVTKPEIEFIGQAGSFGLSQGITLGVHDGRHLKDSLFSFAGRAMAEHHRHALILEHLVPHLHVALIRTLGAAPPGAPALSTREREVLQWLKEGKSNWEIAQILGISERTVRFHVSNILLKLQALTRGHAIALAMEQRLIEW